MNVDFISTMYTVYIQHQLLIVTDTTFVVDCEGGGDAWGGPKGTGQEDERRISQVDNQNFMKLFLENVVLFCLGYI